MMMMLLRRGSRYPAYRLRLRRTACAACWTTWALAQPRVFAAHPVEAGQHFGLRRGSVNLAEKRNPRLLPNPRPLDTE